MQPLTDLLAEMDFERTTAATVVATPQTVIAEAIETEYGSAIVVAKPKLDPDNWVCRATQLHPRFNLLRPGEAVFFDSEHVGFGKVDKSQKARPRLARVAVLNSAGQVILDIYCYYNKVKGMRNFYPPEEFNVWWPDLLSQNGAKSAEVVEDWLKRIFHNRPVVMHAASNDIAAFQIKTDAFATSDLVDTQKLYAGLPGLDDYTPGLANTANLVLGVTSFDEHNPVADAEMTRRLYLAKFPNKELPKAMAHQKGTFVPGSRGRGRGRGGGGGGGRGQGGRGRGGRGRGGAMGHARRDSGSTATSSSSGGNTWTAIAARGGRR